MKWDPPAPLHPSIAAGHHLPSVAGYRVYYSSFADHDLERWSSVEIGPYTTHDLQGLDTHTVYAVQVRAKSTEGRYGNLSEVVVSNRIEQGVLKINDVRRVADVAAHGTRKTAWELLLAFAAMHHTVCFSVKLKRFYSRL